VSERRFLSPAEIADETGRSVDLVLREIKRGRLRAMKVGRRYSVRADWYEAWVEANVVAPTLSAMDTPVPPSRSSPVGSLDRLREIEREGSG
jgi:excisionase family DNA binding protein